MINEHTIRFHDKMQELFLGLSFGDVKLKTRYTEVLPGNAEVGTWLSRNIGLNIPLISAAMDTVTEYQMAIAMAKQGGIGILHKNLSTKEIKFNLDRVKNELNAKITRPITVYEGQTIEQILNMKEEKGFGFHSFPVTSREGKLVGILTETDFDFCEDNSLKAAEVMQTNLYTGDEETTLEDAWNMMKEKRISSLPLTDDNNNVFGMYVLSDVKRIRAGDGSIYSIDENGQLRVGVSVGPSIVKDDELLEILIKKNVDVICLETAHAATKNMHEALKYLKEHYNGDVIVGNISDGENARKLAELGADGIKVGQGPGAICTTRKVAGVGVPQVTAIMDTAYELQRMGDHYKDVTIIADGGLTYSGDIVIAIAAGADACMAGSLFAGTTEAPGEIFSLDGKMFKSYRGMGSPGAMKERGSLERYGQVPNKFVAEGVEGAVPYKGPVSDVIFQLVGGLRSGMGYNGAQTLMGLQENARFVRITSAAEWESHPHNLAAMKEAPNFPAGK